MHLFITSPAVAAPPPLLGLTWPGLTRAEIEWMDAASQSLFQTASGGAVAQWQNHDTHHAGVVRLIRSFDAHDMPCGTLDYTIRFEEIVGSPDHCGLNWRKLPGVGWKVVELTG
jgi:hypothetical protein